MRSLPACLSGVQGPEELSLLLRSGQGALLALLRRLPRLTTERLSLSKQQQQVDEWLKDQQQRLDEARQLAGREHLAKLRMEQQQHELDRQHDAQLQHARQAREQQQQQDEQARQQLLEVRAAVKATKERLAALRVHQADDVANEVAQLLHPIEQRRLAALARLQAMQEELNGLTEAGEERERQRLRLVDRIAEKQAALERAKERDERLRDQHRQAQRAGRETGQQLLLQHHHHQLLQVLRREGGRGRRQQPGGAEGADEQAFDGDQGQWVHLTFVHQQDQDDEEGRQQQQHRGGKGGNKRAARNKAQGKF